MDEVSRQDWNGLLPARSHVDYHPFTDWDFLRALEISGSACAQTGWQPQHIWLEDENNTPIGAMPLYAKSHSMGEYVFDQAWADASERAGIAYYPKLLCAVPFTPAAGPRLLAITEEARHALKNTLITTLQQYEMSGAHITFINDQDRHIFDDKDFLIRMDRQFHFINRDYENFDDFLASLTARKRKKIKMERRKSGEHVSIQTLRGDDIKPEHWDVFYKFYLDTSRRKWGRAYLTREFFARIHETMRDQVLLFIAYQDDVPVAGALNFIGGDTLYGRHWGANKHIPFLHFELCYYQAIDAAITMGLARVEAGAQGDHKLARGYEPIPTYSAHYLRHEGLHGAIENFLDHERQAVDRHINILGEHTPFRKGE